MMEGQIRSGRVASFRRRIAVVIAAAAVAAAIGGAGYAIAANAAAATVFYGCSAADGSVKVITAGTAPVCKPGETLQSWNAQGPQGIPGTPGLPGQPGAQGPAGQASVVGFPHSDCPEFPGSAAGGASSQLLTIPNVPGESTLRGFEDLIEIEGFSWGSSNGQGGAAGCGTGPDASFFFDLTVTKHFDKSSQPIMLANLKGTDLGTIKLQGLKAGGSQPQAFLTIELEHAHVASDQMSGGGGGIDEKVTFTSSKATVSYRTQRADGTLNPAIVICYDAGGQVDCT
jgi:type VI secretion system secreted protein Hcp